MIYNTAIIIVNLNGMQFMKELFEALQHQSYPNFKVFLVDNGSTDNSVEFVEKNYPSTIIVKLSHNTGFAEGNNIAFRKILPQKDYEYLVCLNNDTIPDHDWLQELVKTVDYSRKVDMVSSMALFPSGKVQTVGLRFEKDLIGDNKGGLSIGFEKDPSRFENPFEVFCPSGVSALFTRRLLEEVGLFDQDFFAYVEDLDLGYRARALGYRCISNPKSKLIHFHSQTSGGRANPLKAFLIKRNNYYLALKNFDLANLILFPIRELTWNIKNSLGKNSNDSIKRLRHNQGIKEIVSLMIKMYLNVIMMTPKMLSKRLRSKKY